VSYVHYVSILHDVILALETKRAFGTGVGLRSSLKELVPSDGFSADEMFFEIGVNRSCAFLGARVGRNLPGAAFVFTGGEE
jgi:hypothetical protein